MNKTFFTKVYIMTAVFVLMAGFTGCGKSKDTTKTVTVVENVTAVTESDTEEVSKLQNKEASGDYVITLQSTNSWESDGLKCAQFDGIIKNQTDETGKDWKVTVTVPEGIVLESSWNGNYEVNGTVLTITPVDYNTEVEGKGEISFGFILDTKEEYTLQEVVLTMNGVDYVMGDMYNVMSEKTTNNKENGNGGSDEKVTEEKDAAKADISGSPLANHGALSVKGTDIEDKYGNVYQLKGVSTHGLAWFPDYVNKAVFSSLSEYGVNAIRLAMYTAESGGYCNGGDKQQLEGLVDQGVKACTELGMYVIVDWHILSDGDPNIYKEDAKDFFDKVSKKYAGNDNIMYAVHFYASTHKAEIRNKVEKARENGIAVIVSECSICEASGNGSINYDEAAEWMKLINDNNMSIFAWNLSNKDEQSSLLKASVTKTSGFSKEDFSETGSWYMEQYGK